MDKKYLKNSHRLNLKFIDGDTNELLFEIKNQSWMEIGNFFTDHYVDDVLKNSFSVDKLPENVIVMVAENFKLR
jgi:hypothetical protein